MFNAHLVARDLVRARLNQLPAQRSHTAAAALAETQRESLVTPTPVAESAIPCPQGFAEWMRDASYTLRGMSGGVIRLTRRQ